MTEVIFQKTPQEMSTVDANSVRTGTSPREMCLWRQF
jgi:hypothetical protein